MTEMAQLSGKDTTYIGHQTTERDHRPVEVADYH
jgi:hypothetical protein